MKFFEYFQNGYKKKYCSSIKVKVGNHSQRNLTDIPLKSRKFHCKQVQDRNSQTDKFIRKYIPLSMINTNVKNKINNLKQNKRIEQNIFNNSEVKLTQLAT